MGSVQKGFEGSALCKLCQGATKSTVFGRENNAGDKNRNGGRIGAKYFLSTKMPLSDEKSQVEKKVNHVHFCVAHPRPLLQPKLNMCSSFC